MTILRPFPPSHCIADDRAGVQLLGLKICCRKNLRSCSFLISSSAADGASGQWQWRWPEEVELPPDIILNPAHQTHQPLLPYFRVEKLMHSKITQHRKGFLVLYVLHDRARASCMAPQDVLKVFLGWGGEYDFQHCQVHSLVDTHCMFQVSRNFVCLVWVAALPCSPIYMNHLSPPTILRRLMFSKHHHRYIKFSTWRGTWKGEAKIIGDRAGTMFGQRHQSRGGSPGVSNHLGTALTLCRRTLIEISC